MSTCYLLFFKINYICIMSTDNQYRFCSSYCREAAVKFVIRGKRFFFLRKSKPLWRRNLVGASLAGEGKRMVVKPDADGGYDLSILPYGNHVISLCSHIPDTDWYATYLRIPISVNARDVCIHNTPAIIYNINELKRIPKNKSFLGSCLQHNDYFQCAEKPIKRLAEKIAKECPNDDYLRVLAVHKYTVDYLYYDKDELQAEVRQDDSAVTVLQRRHTTCRGYVSLCVSLLRAMNIPAQQLACYVAKPGQMIDVKNVKPKTNHAVVAVYADNRWLILDPTRDSYNKYEKGKFYDSNEKPSLAHFDMTEQFFSFTHWLPFL